MMTKHVLVVEDNIDIANLIEMHLRDQNFQVDKCHDGNAALNLCTARHYDLLILDIMLPVTDGLEVCRQLRQHKNFTPVLMLTAKSTELDRVLGLETGADDYLTKPFSINELVARIKALLRRCEVYQPHDNPPAQTIRIGNLALDITKHAATLNDRELELTATEFDLLKHFAEHPGHVFSRSQLLDSVWGYGHDGYEHTVNSHINRLRAKIEPNPSRPDYIQTVWGVGYKMTESDVSFL